MPDLRKAPVTGRWVIISNQRAKRPQDFIREPVRFKNAHCAFCPGHEASTPPEILAYRADAGAEANSAGWKVRVVPNKFPALEIEGSLDRQAEGIFDRMNGTGAHEVIIESPDHQDTYATMTEKRIEDSLYAFRDRITDLRNDTRLKYVLIFKNHGEAAGATMEHPHSQLIAMPIVPRQVVEELKGARDYHDQKERCIYCDIIAQETRGQQEARGQEARGGSRVVMDSEQFIIVAPFAPRFPFETWILPKRHDSAFENSPADRFAG